jgi:DNA polymerase III epsilon subunit-like protein
VYPEHKRHNLSVLIERHGFVCQSRHRAYDDAEVLWQFLQMLHKTLPESEFRANVDRLIQPVFYIRPETKKTTFVYERDSQEVGLDG